MDDAAARSTTAVAPPVIGRTAEIQALGRALDEAVAGHGQLILVEGEPGAGKSTLLDVAGALAREHGARVLRGSGEELEEGLRFAAVSGWLTNEDVTLDIRADDLAVTEAIVAAVDQWCTEAPLVLVMDDLQWADEGSLTALHRLGRLASPLPLLLIAAYRPMTGHEGMNSLITSWRSWGAADLALSMLDEAAVADLIRADFGAPPGPTLTAVLREAGGNPLYVTELVAALAQEGTVQVAGGVAEVAPGAERPQSLTATILRRLSFLPEEVREFLRTAAVLGSEVLVADLAMVQHRTVDDLEPLVSVARDSGVLVTSGDRLVFRHELIRRALAEDLPPTVRSALHLEVSHALADVGARPERVAEHVFAATEMDAATLSWLLESAESLATRSPEMAVSLLRRALESARLDSEAIGPLRRELIRALLVVDPLEAEHLARSALRAAVDPSADSELRWLLVQALGQQGLILQQIEEAERALESPFLSLAETSHFYGMLAECLFYIENYDRSAVAARQALDAGREARDPYGEAHGYTALAGVLFFRRATEQALEVLDQAVSVLGDVQIRPDAPLAVQLVRGFCLADLDRYAEADAAFSLGLRDLETTGWTRFVDGHHYGRALLRLHQGKWDDALAEVESGRSAHDSPLGGISDFGAVLSNCEDVIRVQRGDFRGDAETITVLGPGMMQRNYGIMGAWARALLLESMGQADDAFDVFYADWSAFGRTETSPWAYFVMPDLIRLAVTLGRATEISVLDAEVEEILNQVNNETRNAVGTLCRGMLDGDSLAIQRAARRLRRASRPLCYAYAVEHLAVLNATAGLREDARKNAAEALRVYQELGCTWAAARTESRLRDLGVRLGARGPRGRPRTGWEALTDTENRVLALVAEGKSNPEIATIMFLSRRTVASHVSSILAKVQLTSRVELAVAAHERSSSR